MLDFPKSNCLYHPSQTITNFCRQRTCLLPLCPSCVCSHIDFHVKGGDHPKFDNIQDTFSNSHRAISDLTDKLNEDRRRMVLSSLRKGSLQSSFERMQNRLSDTIFQVKLQVRQLIETRFQQLEKEIQAEIGRQCESTGLYSKAKHEYLEGKIADATKQLALMLDDMRTDRCLATMIMFHGEKKQAIEKIAAEMDREVELNFDFEAKININNDAFEMFRRGVGQVLDVKLNIPQAYRRVSKHEPAITARQVRRQTLVLDRPALTPIMNKRPTPQALYFANKQNVNVKLPSNRFRSPSQHFSPVMRPSSLIHRQPSLIIATPRPSQQEYMIPNLASQLSAMTSTAGSQGTANQETATTSVREMSNTKRSNKKSGITLQNTEHRPSRFGQKTE